jgi:hypothetical protein
MEGAETRGLVVLTNGHVESPQLRSFAPDNVQLLDHIAIDRWSLGLSLKYSKRDALTCSIGVERRT